MRRRSSTWVLLCLACLIGAFLIWRLSGLRQSKNSPTSTPAASGDNASATASAGAPQQPSGATPTTVKSASTAPPAMLAPSKVTTNSATSATIREQRLKYRLSNTSQTVGQLIHDDRAVLLENALIDSTQPLTFSIPDSLRSQGDPGSYIVQSRGLINNAFRTMLQEAGATIVAYIPNNAYLVRMSAGAAQQLADQTAPVIPFEPYYKLDTTLLKQVMENKPVNPSVNVLVFPGARVATMDALKQLGAEVVQESPSPFGTQMVVQNANDVPAIARLPGIQRVEVYSERTPANDMTRARVGVTANTITVTNYLGLTGQGVLVDMNDSEVDVTHPDLINRVTGQVSIFGDRSGHGTHVAGIIAGDGTESITVTNAAGSINPGTNGQYRGKAPAANLFCLPIDSFYSDFLLQQAAAGRNALISNNSWTYANPDYDINAASYDAAVRDARPTDTGSQPVLFVFAAGDIGLGDDNGLGGFPESIQSPSTAKNVITVGAIEQRRNITNVVSIVLNGGTNTSQPWLGLTDSSNQVAAFSSRGNVGIGIEGEFGRFKPDLVAPGTFVVSTRSQQWDERAYYNPTNYHGEVFPNETVATNTIANAPTLPPISVPDNAVQVIITATAIDPVVDLPVYVKENSVPTTASYDVLGINQVSLPQDGNLNPGGLYFFRVGNPTNQTVRFNVTTLVVTTNDEGNKFEVLSNLNNSIGEPDWYRYETGTSMSAPAVSGVLALMQEFFQQKSITNSPALMKALLINGARPVNSIYSLQVQNNINFQGWGLVNLTNSIPAAFSNQTAIVNPPVNTPTPMLMFDQSPTNALATGDHRTYRITVDPTATNQPLRVTLVWTDPPGNPSAATKLVNNLDLVVTNLDNPSNPLIYFGNDIKANANFNVSWDTNLAPNLDTVNNVENVYISPSIGTSYSITVIGRAVNVNAVTDQTNNMVQDYALVISSGNAQVGTALTLLADPGIVTSGAINLTVMTNQFSTTSPDIFGQVLGHQRVGANSPLIGTNTVPYQAGALITIGETNQWHFYLITNSTPFTNAVFATSLPINLAPSRMGVTNTADPSQATRPQADIDLYVNTDVNLLSLDPIAVATARKSLGRGGFEQIIYTNAVLGQVYYIGIKSEDHQAADYTFTSLFSLLPFDNGDNTFTGYPTPADIPDGTPALPGSVAVTSYAATEGNTKVRSVTLTNLITHENFGDLVGTLTHDGQKPVVLNNHSPNNNYPFYNVYEDNGGTALSGTQRPDGPGSLTDYIGDEVTGQWSLVEVDNSFSNTGRVDGLTIHIDPHLQDDLPPGATSGIVLRNCVVVQPGSFEFDFVEVPFNGLSVNLCLSNAAPMVFYVRNGAVPTLTTYDYIFTNNSVNGCLSVSLSDLPPLQPGNLYFGIYNPNPVSHLVCYTAELTVGPTAVPPVLFSSTSTPGLFDDEVNFSSIVITNNRTIASAAVGVVLNHPRVSDLVLTLISPLGERFLLYENRGVNETNLGHLNITTNFFGTQTAGAAAANTNILGPVPNTGTLLINYDFFTVPDSLDVYYDGVNIFTTGGLIPGAGQFVIPYGPGVGNTITIVMNQGGNPNTTTAWVYTPEVVALDYTYLTFTEDPRQASTAIKFARPPFDLANSGTNFPLSDFELATNGTYLGPTNIYDAFGGWNLFSNRFEGTNLVIWTNNLISIVTDTNTAQFGSNYLALGLGTIAHTNIPTTPGRKYTFGYWYRGPGISGWWRGEGNALDSADPEQNGNNGSLVGSFTFPEGEVGQAFQFGGTNGFDAQQQLPGQSYVQVPQSPSLNVGGGSGLTVEGWINPTNIFVRQPLVEWLAPIPTNWVPVIAGETNLITTDTNLVPVGGPFLNPTTGHYYYLLPSTNWTRSEQWANALGGHLATVEDADEENWIYDLFSQYGGTNRTLWIGLNDAATPGTFVWAGGQTSMFYTNWANAQPSNTCFPSQNYVAILNPTNVQASLWTLADNNGRTCGFPPTNRIHGVVEVEEIQTNGVQFWVSVTNSVITGTGCLYADLVDTNNVSHIIYSAPGLLQTNGMQHVALTYDRVSGIAALYYSGTNVATTNVGVFVPKTGGDVLIGKHMSRQTNNIFVGRMDEVSIYNRFLSAAEIAAIYNISVSSSNRTVGKFDQSITPALGLAEAQVSIGDVTNTILGANTKWQISTYTFTATTNYMPMQVAGIEPGMLMDSFTVSEAPLGNLYYLPETFLSDLVNQNVRGTWTLEIRDSRAGPSDTNTVGQLISWQMQFIYQNNAPTAVPLSPFEPSTNVVPAGKTAYFTVDVPLWATSATNILVSASSSVDLLFNQTTPPTGLGAGDIIMLPASTGGVGLPILVTNAVPPLLPGLRYYLGVRNSGAAPATVVVRVDYNITTLTNSVPVASHFATNEFVRYFAFDVSSNAVEATFQLLKLSNNVDLVVRHGVPLPTLTSSDLGSFNTANADENIYVVTTNIVSTNALEIPLSPGRWYIGVFKRDPVANFSVLAKELDPPLPTIIELSNNVPFTFTTGPGAALTNFFHFNIADNTTNSTVGAIHFELYNMSGNGDLTVQTNGPPYAPIFWQSSQQPGVNPELIFIQTNSALTNLVEMGWYLGVPNHETNLITYTILAVIDFNGYFPAFPGAEGAGGGASGGGRVGQIGDVYHVSSLSDSGPGSLRDAVNSATTNRTIVFDVSGNIMLQSPLKIDQPYLTIAGQTAPGDGITVQGWVTSVQNTHDVVVRYMRFRPGDTNCPINQDDAFHFVNSSNVIADHISASWSIDEVVSATLSTNVTVQWSVIADSLNDSCHISDIDTNTTQKHGYGSLLRYGYGTLSFHHNLYADNYSRNPRLGDNISLDFVNNVIYNWGILPGYSADDSADNPLGFTNYLNYVNNYLITGTNFIGDSNVVAYIAFSGGSTNTWIFQTNNVMDANTNGILDGARTGWGMFTNDYTGFGRPFALPPVSTDEAFLAYERVLAFAGTAMDKRDSVDQLIVGNVRTQSGNIIDSQTQDGGWPALNPAPLPLDSDQDGIPDYWEITLGENPTNASNNLDRNGDGYTDLEEYINWLGVPHALTVTNTPVGVDLFQMFGNTGNLSFAVTNAIQGFVYLTNILDAVTNVAGPVTNVIGPVTNTGPYSNSFAIFTPTNNLPFTNNYSGYASFDVYVTNNDTIAYFGPVKVSVMVSAVPIIYASPNTNTPPVLSTNLPNLTNNEQTTIIVTNTATDANTNLTLSYTVTLTIDTNAMIANGWPLNYATTVPSPTIDTNGIITWTPSEAQGPGVYIITTVVSDNSVPSLQAANSFTVTVNEINTPPFWPPGVPSQTNYVIVPTATLVVTNTAADSDIPPNPLTYTLIVSPPVTNAVISTNGIITWTPAGAPPGLYAFTTIVTDTNQFAVNAKSMSATNLFTVFVTNVAAPFVFTQPAQAVTGSSAQLNGMVTPNGLPTAAWYQWGTNTSYGNVTLAVNVGTSFNVVYTPSPIFGLVTNTAYHFRLVASNAVGITFGFDQILDESYVVEWGANYVGQATVPPGLSNVVAIAGAYDHSLALKNNETVVGWGDNTFGQAAVPVGLNNVLAVAGGQYYSIALRIGGTVTSWGANILGQTNVPPGLNNVVMIAGGTFSSLALKNVGTVTAWGANFFNLTNVPAGASNIVSIAGGGFHNLAVQNNGTVVAWGDNSAGQLNVPPGLTNVVAISGGNYHSLALRYNGTVVAWGDNSAGQLNVPPGLSNVVAIAAGGFHSLALKSDGNVVTWGDNSAGQSSVPIGLSNVVAVASGYFHSMALTSLFFGNSTNPVVLDLTNGVPQTNSILAGGIIYYRVFVPTNADFATNSLLFALNGPLNVWYSTNTPPSITNVNDVLLLPGVTNGISVLSTNTAPAYLIPGSIYYLGVQNTNAFTVNYGIEVDFHLTLPVITLTNAIPYTNSNSAAGIATDYYRFVVSSNSARAQFEVDNPSGDVTLVVRRGLPLPSLGSYDYISANSYTNMELIVVLTNSTVSLIPGDWFISVVNVSGGPVTYSVKATEWPVTGLPVDITDISFSPTNVCITWDSLIGAYYYVQGLTTLTSTNWVTISPTILATNTSTTYCVPLPSPYSFFRVLDGIDLSQSFSPSIVTLTNLITYSVTNSAGTNGLDYYRYNVSANASSVRFEVLNPSGNVTLLARYGQPLPSLGLYDYISSNGGTSNELILVSSNSVPVPLTPGGWYLAVSNASGTPVSYTILATELTNTPPTIITLTNMIGYANSNSGAGQATDSYRFVVSSNSARAQFEVDNPSGDVTLVARRGLPLPSLSSYNYISTNSYTNTELIVVLTNSSPIALAPGDWYLSVVNVSGGPVTYSVKATEWPVTGLPVDITDISFSPTNVCITWDSLIGAYYYVQGLTTLTSTNWTTISPTILATNTSTTYCVPLPSPYSFFRVQEGLVLSTNLPLLPTIIDLTNGIPYLTANAGGTNTVGYYRYVVTTNAARAQFEVNNSSGDVVLMARKGLPLPTLGNYDYVSTNSFTNDELIVVFTNSSPVALTPGDWYLAVSNASGGAITYAVKATEWPVTGLPVNITDISFSPTNVCITWDSLIGAYYYVQGLTTLTSTNWTTISPTILATNTSTTYCVPLPSPYSFFRVQEGLVLSTNSALLPTIIDLTNGVPYLNANAGGTNRVDYYRYVVTANAARAQFEVNNSSGDVVLMARKGLPLPTLGNYDYVSTNSFTNDELIVIFTNSVPALTPGDWYLAVSNASGGAITYAVKATEWPSTGLPVDITDISFSPTNICITWDSLVGAHYYVQGLTTLGSTNWVTISATILATNTSTTYCVPLPSPYNFFRVEEGLVLSTNTATSPIVITLTNASPYLNSNLGGVNPVDYYRFVVSTNSARAQFEVNNPGGDVTLMARNGLPLPTLANAGYLSQNPSTNDELIVVFTNSLPVALTPGDWYLAVSNASGGAVAYSVKATEWSVSGVPIGISSISFSSSSICLTWNSLAGVHYYIQGLTGLGSTNWTLASPAILATNTTTTYCISLPSPYSYFRVEEGLVLTSAPVVVPPPVISAVFTNNGFLLRWNGPVSAQYKAQWASNLPPSWNFFTNIITSVSGQFSFFDDGSQTAGLGVTRFYRVVVFP